MTRAAMAILAMLTLAACTADPTPIAPQVCIPTARHAQPLGRRRRKSGPLG